MIDSPVLELLETLGGHRAARRGRVTAAHFGDPSWEYEAVRRSVGLVDASHLGAIRIGGADRTAFLENMLSGDVKDLGPGHGRLTSLLTPKGKFVALFRLLAFAESYLALLDRDHVDSLKNGLDPFILLEEVEIEDESLRWGTIHVAGPLSVRLLSNLSGSPLPHMPPHHYRTIALPGIESPALVVRDCSTGEDGFDLFVTRKDLPAAWKLLVRCESPRPVPVGADPFDMLRLEAGTPLFGVDVDGSLGPVEAGLPETFSLQKGCYPGQEMVAKTSHRGKPPKTLTGIELDGNAPPVPGTAVLAGEVEVGRITSAVRSPLLDRIIALAVIRTAALEKGAPLHIAAGDRNIAARPVERPFR